MVMHALAKSIRPALVAMTCAQAALLLTAWPPPALASAALQDARDLSPREQVIRRGDLPPAEGEIVRLDDAGVAVRIPGTGAGAKERVISWHEVREVTGATHRDAWLRYQPVAEDLWRAVSRLQRGDTMLALPLFERLFERYRGQTNEPALLAAEGLLRCQLAQAANELAVIPWLEVVRLRDAGVTSDALTSLSSVIDEATSLCPQLPPAWVSAARTTRLERDLAAYDAQGDERVAALASLYRAFASISIGNQPVVNEVKSDEPGVTMLSHMLGVRTAKLNAVTGRDAMRRTHDWPAWAQAWLHVQIGESLLREKDRPSQDLGLVHLAHLPAAFARTQPYLAGLALRTMAEALDARGEANRAASLRRLVSDRYPGHPAAEAPFGAAERKGRL